MIDFNRRYWILIAVVSIIMMTLVGCSGFEDGGPSQLEEDNLDEKIGQTKLPDRLEDKKKGIIAKYQDRTPTKWGEDLPGVITRIDTDKKVVALTLDACGSPGDGYDSKLMDFLIEEEISATLFINSRWIDDNQETFMELAHNPLFTIANHGTRHLPLSVNGRSAYGIGGTTSVEEVVDEVLENEWKIQNLTGEKPKYFRAGTAYYDEVAVEIVNELGEKVIGYDTLGDAGATFTKEQVKNAFLSVSPGSIILAHMNRPESDTAEGIREAVPELKSRGFEFVKLEDYDSQLVSELEQGDIDK